MAAVMLTAIVTSLVNSYLPESILSTSTLRSSGARDAGSSFFGSALAVISLTVGSRLAVGAPSAEAGGYERGELHILELSSGGAVVGSTIVNSSVEIPVLSNALAERGRFGTALAALDLDGDGLSELAVGSPGATGHGSGHISILRFSPDASSSSIVVSGVNAVGDGFGGFDGGDFGPLADGEQFGSALATLPDLDGDGIPELAVSSRVDRTGTGNDGRRTQGCIFVLFLRRDGTVKRSSTIYAGSGGSGVIHQRVVLFGGAMTAWPSVSIGAEAAVTEGEAYAETSVFLAVGSTFD